MPTVQHPRLPEITREVTVDELPNWLAQGWVDTAPTETPEPERVALVRHRKRT